VVGGPGVFFGVGVGGGGFGVTDFYFDGFVFGFLGGEGMGVQAEEQNEQDTRVAD
jgi:hypothetical protein